MSAEHDLQQLRDALWHTSTRILGTALHPDDCPGCVGLAALSRVGERIDAQQDRISELESLVAKSGNRTPDVRADAEAHAFLSLPREQPIPSDARDFILAQAALLRGATVRLLAIGWLCLYCEGNHPTRYCVRSASGPVSGAGGNTAGGRGA